MSDLGVKSGDELVLNALKKEHKRLARIAERAKKECDEALNVGSELIAINNEFVAIVNSREIGKHVAELENLKRRDARARKIMKKNLMDLMDRQFDAEGNVRRLS